MQVPDARRLVAGIALAISPAMLSCLSPFVVAFLQTFLSQPPARLEHTARGADARALAAEVLVDADALIDLVLVDHAATFELELAGERHELRVELDRDGAVIGAAVWWLGAADADGPRHDLVAALPALDDAGTLDAVIVDARGVALVAGDVVVPVAAEPEEDLEDVDGDGDFEWGC
jgi:hypothetical protein